MLFRSGLGVEPDPVLGHAWIAMSLQQEPYAYAEIAIENLASDMSREQIAEARRLVSSGELMDQGRNK